MKRIRVMVVDDSLQFARAAGADAFLPKDDFAHRFHAVLDMLFATSSFSKESEAWDR